MKKLKRKDCILPATKLDFPDVGRPEGFSTLACAIANPHAYQLRAAQWQEAKEWEGKRLRHQPLNRDDVFAYFNSTNVDPRDFNGLHEAICENAWAGEVGFSYYVKHKKRASFRSKEWREALDAYKPGHKAPADFRKNRYLAAFDDPKICYGDVRKHARQLAAEVFVSENKYSSLMRFGDRINEMQDDILKQMLMSLFGLEPSDSIELFASFFSKPRDPMGRFATSVDEAGLVLGFECSLVKQQGEVATVIASASGTFIGRKPGEEMLSLVSMEKLIVRELGKAVFAHATSANPEEKDETGAALVYFEHIESNAAMRGHRVTEVLVRYLVEMLISACYSHPLLNRQYDNALDEFLRSKQTDFPVLDACHVFVVMPVTATTKKKTERLVGYFDSFNLGAVSRLSTVVAFDAIP